MRRFTPFPLPRQPDHNVQALTDEVVNVQQEIENTLLTVYDLDAVTVAPDKPFAGMVRYADGTEWDPGAGEGPYVYRAGGWYPMWATADVAQDIWG